MNNVIISGKRKQAVARAVVTKGKGNISVNGKNLEVQSPYLAKMKMKEPLLLAGEKYTKGVDIAVTIKGGSVMSQADAGRLAIAKGLVAFHKADDLEKIFLQYDRNMLVADVRRKEICKPNDSKARAKRQKSYR